MPSRKATSVSHSIIPIFGGDNYDSWKVKMMALLRSEGLWSIVQHGLVQPTSPGKVTQTQNEEHDVDAMNDAKALSKIQNGVNATIFARICRATTAKQAWEILENEYQGNRKTDIIRLEGLQLKFHNLKMKESECVQGYSSRVIEVVDQIRSLGEEMTDQKVVEKVLISLPEKYDSIVAAIQESRDISTLSIEQVMGSLRSYEQRRHSRINNGGKIWGWRLCR